MSQILRMPRKWGPSRCDAGGSTIVTLLISGRRSAAYAARIPASPRPTRLPLAATGSDTRTLSAVIPSSAMDRSTVFGGFFRVQPVDGWTIENGLPLTIGEAHGGKLSDGGSWGFSTTVQPSVPPGFRTVSA